jgi:hypothetical protein
LTDGTRRDQLDDARDLVLAVLESRSDQAEAGFDATERDGDQCLRAAAIDEVHDATVAGDRWLDVCEGPAESGCLPTPRRPDGRGREGLDGQARRRLATDDPGRRPVRERQPFLVRPDRWLAEDQADPATPARQRARAAATAGRVVFGRLGADRSPRRRTGNPEHGGRRAIGQAPQVLADPRLDRAIRATLESLDEAAHEADAVLEGEPRVALSPLGRAGRTDPSALDPERADPAREAVEPAGRQERVEEGEAEGGFDGRRTQVALDPLEDRLEPDELARAVEIEQPFDEAVAAVEHREAIAKAVADDIGAIRCRAGSNDVVGVDGCRPLIAAAALATTDVAAVLLPDRRPGLLRGSVVAGRTPTGASARPDDLVGDDHPLAAGTARRERLPDGHPQAGRTMR